jgi:hypothetical protein
MQTTIALVVGLPGENWKTISETAIFLAKSPPLSKHNGV